MPLEIGLLTFPDVQQLDLTAPYEVFVGIPEARVHLVAADRGPVTSSTGLVLAPTLAMADCPQLDVLCVPGGLGVNPLMRDAAVLAFLRDQAEGARYVTSVCTGALVLGAAGLLRGRRATTHWASLDLLAAFGAIPVAERVVRDGNLLTGRRRHRRDRLRPDPGGRALRAAGGGGDPARPRIRARPRPSPPARPPAPARPCWRRCGGASPPAGPSASASWARSPARPTSSPGGRPGPEPGRAGPLRVLKRILRA